MAGEITVGLNGQISIGTGTGALNEQIFPAGSIAYDSSTKLRDTVVKSIPTTDTNLTALLPNTATIEGLLYIKNLDATNYVKVGPTVAGAIAPFSRLNPGKAMHVPLEPGMTLRAQANVAACQCDIRLYAGNGTSGA